MLCTSERVFGLLCVCLFLSVSFIVWFVDLAILGALGDVAVKGDALHKNISRDFDRKLVPLVGS